MKALVVLLLYGLGAHAQETYLPSGLRESCEKYKTTRKQFDALPESQSAKCREAVQSSMQACREKSGPSHKELNGIVVGAGAKGAAGAQRKVYEDSRDVFMAQAKTCEERRSKASEICGADYKNLMGKHADNARSRADIEREMASASSDQRAALQGRLRENMRTDRTLREDMENSQMMSKLGDQGLDQLAKCNVGEAYIYDAEANRANTSATSASADGPASQPKDQRGLVDKYGDTAKNAAADNIGGNVASKGARALITKAIPAVAGPAGLVADTAIDQVTSSPTAKCDDFNLDPINAYTRGCRANVPSARPQSVRSPANQWEELEPSGY